MKGTLNRIIMTTALGGALAAGTSGLRAAEVTVGADVASSYVWRGITLNEDAVVQPSVNIAHPSGLELNIWGNFDLGDDDGALEKRQFSEVDFTVTYNLDFEMFTLSIGYIEYVYPGQTVVDVHGVTRGQGANREVLAGIGSEVVPGLTLGLTGYYEFEEWRDAYVEATAGYELEVLDRLILGVNGSIGYAGNNFSEEGNSGLHDYLVGGSAAYVVRDHVSVSVFVSYVDSVRTKTLPSELVRKNWVGGAGIYCSF